MIYYGFTLLSCLCGAVTYYKITHAGLVRRVVVKVPSYTEGMMMTTDTDVKGLA